MRKIAILSLALFILGAGVAGAAERVTFTLDWVIQGFHAGYFAARDRGHYQKAGLDVTILRGHGSGDTIKKVGAGASEYGFADAASLVPARSEGVKVKELAIIYDRSMFGLYSLKEAGIRGPKDLEGKTIATSPGNAVYVVFPAFAAANGIDASKVKWEIMAVGVMVPSLLAGKVHASAHYAVSAPTIFAKAKEMGKEASALLYSDWGLDVYSNGLITTDQRIKEKADEVRRFARATLEGVAWAADSPDEATALFLRQQPEVDPKTARAQFQVVLDHMLTPTAYEKGLGYIRHDKMTLTRDLLTKYMNLKTTVPVEDLYTNDFNPGIKPKKR